jgi:inhibitor of KinA
LKPYHLTYKRFGERAILIEWQQIIDKNILFDILRFKEKITNSKIDSVIELKSAYNSLLVVYDKFIDDFEYSMSRLKIIYDYKATHVKSNFRQWNIPVCYDAVFAKDLEVVSEEKNLSQEAIIKRHYEVIYTVYFIGFLPGFLYLGGLDSTLSMPRKSTPRLHIERGAVAIGGNQTGVYPVDSPGGWNIIGNSPIEFFDVTKKSPCFAKAGDTIVFYPISLKEHENIKILVASGVHQIESEVVYG